MNKQNTSIKEECHSDKDKVCHECLKGYKHVFKTTSIIRSENGKNERHCEICKKSLERGSKHFFTHKLSEHLSTCKCKGCKNI